MKHLLFISILFMLTCHQQLMAQVYSAARILTTDDGLSDNRINCVYKDKKGFIWIGTRNGLNRYDGHSFRIFTPVGDNAISNEIINSITEDSNGHIWVATMNGLNSYDPIHDHWETIMPAPGKTKPGLPNNLVWDIQFDKNGLLWIASDVFEFSSYNPVTKLFTFYDWPGFAKTLPPIAASHYTSIQQFTRKSDNEFWLATNRGLVLLNISTKTFTLAGSYHGTVKSIWYDAPTGKAYITLDKGECFLYDDSTKILATAQLLPDPYPSTQLFGNHNQQRWLAATTGILTLPGNSSTLRLSKHIPGFTGSLLPGAVNTVYTDNTGLRWVGTDNGLALYDAKPRSNFIPLLPSLNNSIGNTMSGIYFDAPTNSYFVCSLNPAAVFVIPTNGDAITKMVADATGESFPPCNNITADRNGSIWLLTDRYCYRYDRSRKSFQQFATPNHGADAGFRNFMQDAAGNYWFGTYLKGIYLYNTGKQQFDSINFPFLPFTKKIGSLRLDTIRNSIWISAYSSDVIRYDVQSGKMEGFEDRPGLSALNLVNDILVDHSGNTWMATSDNGIFKMPAGKIPGVDVKQFTMKTGLPENTFVAMAEDQQGYIWLLSETGLCAIDATGKLVQRKQSAAAAGLTTFTSDSRSAHPIVFNPANNEVAAAAHGGLYLRSTAALQSAPAFNIVITSVRTGSRDSLTEYTGAGQSGRLPYRNNALRIEFAGLYYGSPEEIQYEYQLSGYDNANQWHPTSNYTALYQNLPPGNYRFTVRASDNGTVITAYTYPVSFTVVPPFWKTTWFIFLVTILAVTGITLVVYSLLQKIKAEKLLNEFATSLYGKNNLEDICNDVASNCVQKLGATACIIYHYDEDRQLLLLQGASENIQKLRHDAEYASIPFSTAMAAQVIASKKLEPSMYNNQEHYPRVVPNSSSILLPLVTDEKLLGISDTVQPNKQASRFQRKLLVRVAALCAERMARYQGEERLRGKIARDLHDEMGSTLTSINIMSTVAMQNGGTPGKVNEYLQTIKDNSARILESIGDMVWVINPVNDNFENFLLRMKEFAAEMLEPAGIHYHFVQEGATDQIQLHLARRKELYMIFKESITNAVKYSHATEITVHLQTSNGMLQMSIADNGSGFNLLQTSTGNGLSNMKSRAAAMGASIHIDSAKDRGTRIQVNMPLTL